MHFITIVGLILSQAIALPIVTVNPASMVAIWFTSAILWLNFVIVVVWIALNIRWLYSSKQKPSVSRLIYEFLDAFFALQLVLACLGTTIELLSSDPVFSFVDTASDPYDVFWGFMFPTAVGNFNGVGFARMLPLKVVPSIWAVTCTWVGVIYRVLLTTILVWSLTRVYSTRQIRSRRPIK